MSNKKYYLVENNNSQQKLQSGGDYDGISFVPEEYNGSPVLRIVGTNKEQIKKLIQDMKDTDALSITYRVPNHIVQKNGSFKISNDNIIYLQKNTEEQVKNFPIKTLGWDINDFFSSATIGSKLQKYLSNSPNSINIYNKWVEFGLISKSQLQKVLNDLPKFTIQSNMQPNIQSSMQPNIQSSMQPIIRLPLPQYDIIKPEITNINVAPKSSNTCNSAILDVQLDSAYKRQTQINDELTVLNSQINKLQKEKNEILNTVEQLKIQKNK